MSTARADLNKLGKKPPYLLFSIVLITLSAVAVYFFYFSQSPSPTPSSPSSPPATPTPDSFYPLIPTSPPTDTDPSIPPFLIDDSPPASISAQPSPSPTPDHQTFTDNTSTFTVKYSSSRTLYEDKTNTANRYTFYSLAGSIALHVGPDWSWQHPGREFTPIFKIDGQDTFRYDINLQTIVDIQKDDKKYTIQCVHNAKEELKEECAQFFDSFKFSN